MQTGKFENTSFGTQFLQNAIFTELPDNWAKKKTK